MRLDLKVESDRGVCSEIGSGVNAEFGLRSDAELVPGVGSEFILGLNNERGIVLHVKFGPGVDADCETNSGVTLGPVVEIEIGSGSIVEISMSVVAEGKKSSS